MLNLKGKIHIIRKLADQFDSAVGGGYLPSKVNYVVQDTQENSLIESFARKSYYKVALEKKSLVKLAFDTRKFNPETDRNPRIGLQHYHRSDEFLNRDDEKKIEILARLINPLNDIKNKFGSDTDWHDSYARLLLDNLNKALIVKESELDVFRPQVEYLSQILDLRYRLSLDDIAKMSSEELSEIILKKDEKLLKKGSFLKEMVKREPEKVIVKDSNGGITQESIVNAIFGNNNIRREGEKTVERTITITIKDTVLD